MPDETPQLNTHKVRAIVASIIAGALQFLESVASAPPEIQDGLLRQLVEVMPPHWRPGVALWSGIFKWALSAYAVTQAAKSGPHTPPPSDPNK